MANRTVRDAVSVHGTNPQYLIEKILRERIVEDAYWKEHCFALTAESVIDKAVELAYVGGTFGQHVKPSPFLCLTLKLLQLQPSHDIIMTYIENTDFKYLRALGAFYLRLTAQSLEIYEVLEPLYTDFRKLRTRNKEGEYGLTHMDEFIDRMLRDDRVCDVALPRLMQRHVLEVSGQLEPRVSVLEEDMEDNEEAAGDDSADDGEAEKPDWVLQVPLHRDKIAVAAVVAVQILDTKADMRDLDLAALLAIQRHGIAVEARVEAEAEALLHVTLPAAAAAAVPDDPSKAIDRATTVAAAAAAAVHRTTIPIVGAAQVLVGAELSGPSPWNM
ncbi:pre-mRNA-splicing factor 38A [Capsaspora owczarzaki ATCC 30864]|uniref:Pre-mRNA-splicing factor 38 n=1 Tax=Capsaspora owczarzaki (strain ATCC 30864) TaxID=595528 RepID=A0A0D2WQ43_CAPO3|nr:pre-mRNA-splicing factor 38A [Capsaspora owczarzaki ATCC 30864]